MVTLGNEWACTISAISSSGQALGNEWACTISAVLLVGIKKNDYFLCSFSIIPSKSQLGCMPTRCPLVAQSSESQIPCMPTRCPEPTFWHVFYVPRPYLNSNFSNFPYFLASFIDDFCKPGWILDNRSGHFLLSRLIHRRKNGSRFSNFWRSVQNLEILDNLSRISKNWNFFRFLTTNLSKLLKSRISNDKLF